nr:proline-rich receptor-like protein kinase PERK2 [Equus caballus]
MVTRGPAQALPVSSGPAPRPLQARTLSPDSQDPTSYRPRPGPLPVLLLMAQTTTPGSLDPPPACPDPPLAGPSLPRLLLAGSPPRLLPAPSRPLSVQTRLLPALVPAPCPSRRASCWPDPARDNCFPQIRGSLLSVQTTAPPLQPRPAE